MQGERDLYLSSCRERDPLAATGISALRASIKAATSTVNEQDRSARIFRLGVIEAKAYIKLIKLKALLSDRGTHVGMNPLSWIRQRPDHPKNQDGDRQA